MRLLAAPVLAILLQSSICVAAAPAPVEAFFSRDRISEAELSPSGQWLAITAPAGTGRRSLAVVDSEGKQPPIVIASFSNADVFSFYWVNNDWLVFNIADLSLEMSERKFGGGLFAIKRDGSAQRQLIYAHHAFEERNQNAGRPPLENRNRLLFVPRGEGNTVIVGESLGTLQGDLDTVVVKRLNIIDGSATMMMVGQPERANRWKFDPSGEPRLVQTLSQGQVTLFWRAPGKQTWAVIARFPETEAPFTPDFVDADGRLYVRVPEGAAGTEVVKQFDFATGKPAAEPIVRTPGFDFRGRFVVDPADGRVHGVHVDTDAMSTAWFDKRMKEIQAVADRRFAGHVNLISCRHCVDPDVVLVESWSDRDPGSIWIYRPKSDAWSLVGAIRPDIDPKTMATLDLHRIKARDGEDLPVWVTTPPGAVPAGGRPAVALIHGGPWVRGVDWRWNPEAQFLASRGYVVIEPEFRSSTGYGTAHEKVGWKHWGDTMQDDVADAVDWVARNGTIDPHRVCIAGASYGGYSTLMSMIRFPDKYRCGVAWVAVTDPQLMFQASWQSDLPQEWRDFGLPARLGDPVTEAAMLRAASPAERASEIRAPLMLAFGRDDRRVPIEHGTKMRDALRAAGRPPEWIVYEGEGHGWYKTENNYDFWKRVEAFLAKNL